MLLSVEKSLDIDPLAYAELINTHQNFLIFFFRIQRGGLQLSTIIDDEALFVLNGSFSDLF